MGFDSVSVVQGCRDHTLLPYTIWSLQGYPSELVHSSGMDVTLDDVLMILDKHYNNMKAVLSQKQADGQYHPVTYGSWVLMAYQKNYHSTKFEFLALKWAITEHFKEYLLYQPFIVRTDNNPLTYIMTTPNLDATGYWWVGALARI